MTETDREARLRALKALIIEATGKDMDPGEIPDDAPLFGPEATLELDSVDGLQISMALQRRYGVRIADSKALRRVLTSVNHLADHLDQEGA